MPPTRVTTLIRRGSIGVPEPDFLEYLPAETVLTHPITKQHTVRTTETYAKLYRPTIIWDIDGTRFQISVTETVQFGWRWIVSVLIGICLVIGGEVLGWLSIVDPTTSVAMTILGAGILTSLYAVVARYSCLDQSVFSVTSRESKFTASALLVLCCLGGIFAMTNVLSVLAALVAGCLVCISVVREGAPFRGLEQTIRKISNRIPRVPARHSIFTLLAATTLTVYNISVTALSVSRPILVLAVSVGIFPIVVGLLWYIPSRPRARVHAFGAAVLSGAAILLSTIQIAEGSQVTGPSIDQMAPLPMIAIALGSILFFGGVWWVGVANPQRIQTEFTAQGRQVSTHVAAIFAYLTIMGSGLLGLSALVTLAVLWQLLMMEITPWFGLVTVAVLLPLLYFIAGSLYQLINVVRLSWRFRRHATPVSQDQVPIESEYPIKSLPSEILNSKSSNEDENGVLFAAAYFDPLGRTILLTEYTLSELSDNELAAIIAHEESHFEYRGAELQFLFATVPAAALIGKNVVYAIYNFFRRELTADQYAYVRLASDRGASSSDDLRAAMARFQSDSLPLVDETSLGFLPTMLSAPNRISVSSWIEQWFMLFFGNFAGDVHPSVSTRRRALFVSDDLPLDAESDPEDRAGLIFNRLEKGSRETSHE